MESIVSNRMALPSFNKRSTPTLGEPLDEKRLLLCIRPFHACRLIEISEDLEELDLDENVIGHVGGSIILEALKARKESESWWWSSREIRSSLCADKLKKIKINVSEKIDQYVFADILKLSVKMKKKRKRAKKKVQYTQRSNTPCYFFVLSRNEASISRRVYILIDCLQWIKRETKKRK